MKNKQEFCDVKIIKRFSDVFYLQDFTNNLFYYGKLKGNLKKENVDILVGDFVTILLTNEKFQLICKVLKRKNCLQRPKVANLENVFFVQALKHPQIDWLFFLKIIISINYQIQKRPFLIFTKKDLIASEDLIWKKIAFCEKFFSILVLHQNETQKIIDIKKKLSPTNAFIGRSGVGKSTLLNLLDPSLNLKTKIISSKTKLGKHQTTTNTYFLIENKLVADTPGFNDLDLSHLSLEEIVKNIPFFEDLSQNCHFKNCLHFHEPKCYLKKIILEDKNLKFFYDLWIKFLNKRNQK